MAITPEMVKALREKTGLPMMECKRALEEAAGNEQKAIELLRQKGMSQLTKRAGRVTTEGRVACHVDPATGRTALVEVLCETAPVADTADFKRLVAYAGQAATRVEQPTAESLLNQPLPDAPARTLNDFLHEVVNRIRENIRIGRVACFAGHIGHYLHHDGKKGVLVEFSRDCPAALKADVCMHIAAMRPPYARREDVEPELIAQERRLASEQVRGKPENIIEKIVTGKLNKWFAEVVLLEQPFVKDDKRTVGQVLREVAPDLTVSRFVRFEIGEA